MGSTLNTIKVRKNRLPSYPSEMEIGRGREEERDIGESKAGQKDDILYTTGLETCLGIIVMSNSAIYG